jgi:hypothetical protein
MNRTAQRYYSMNRGSYDSSHGSSSTRKRLKPYIYRRETSLSSTDKEGRPHLTISGKLREKENYIFGGAPNLYDLANDDRGNRSNKMSKDDLKEFQNDEKEKERKRKENKKKVPSNQEVRDHLRIIASYHKKEINETMPSAYPLLGRAGDSDSDDSNNTQKRKNKKVENSDSKPVRLVDKTGKSKSKKQKRG